LLRVIPQESTDISNFIVVFFQVCPPLRRAELLLDLANNFAYGDDSVKRSLANLGLADDVHKLWMWSLHVPSLLEASLRLLITITSNCVRGTVLLFLDHRDAMKNSVT